MQASEEGHGWQSLVRHKGGVSETPKYVQKEDHSFDSLLKGSPHFALPLAKMDVHAISGGHQRYADSGSCCEKVLRVT